jgi:hypothetical protein
MRGQETPREKAAAIAEMRDRPEDGALVIQISRHTWDWCLDVADAYLAAVPEPVSAEWRPIETAPRDGAWFLIAVDGGYEVGRYDPSFYDRYVEVEGGLYRKEREIGWEWEGFNNIHRATHWTPLPPHPGVPLRAGAGGRPGEG